MVEELPVGYYLDNFEYVLDYVLSHYPDLLTPDEVGFAVGFQTLSLDAQRLYVRLCSRKGPLFRDDKLAYAEIDSAAAIEALVVAGYVDFAPDAGIPELLGLLTKAELFNLRAEFGDKSLSRARLLEQLSGLVTPCDVHAGTSFRVIRPLCLEIVGIYKLLFFGNRHQDFTEFVLHELGISPFESYVVHPEDRYFDDRRVLEQTLHLYALDELAREAVEAGDAREMHAAASAIPVTVNETLLRRADKIRNRIARQFERLDLPDAALALYRRSAAAPSRERQARILQKLDKPEAALACCHDIVSDPQDEAEYEFAAAYGRRLLRQEGKLDNAFPDLLTGEFCTREVTVAPQPAIHVEELARCWFEEQGNEAWYVENSLFPGLFGLAFWDIIFASRKGAFFNPFQRGPADLFTLAFKSAAAPLIRERLDELADAASFRQRILDTFAAKYAIANYFVFWPMLSERLLLTTFERIPVAHMLAVFSRLLRDLKNNRSGFPDLVVFPDSGGYRLAEVKGPGDSLQNNQKRWLRFFQQQQMPAEVVKVSWTER